MSQLPLHRGIGGRRHWAIAGTPLVVFRRYREISWIVAPYADRETAQAWLDRHGLVSAEFATRRQALHAVAACLDLEPLPLDLERLRRAGPNRFLTRDGRYEVQQWKSGRQWNVRGNGGAWGASSLAAARLIIARDRLELTPPQRFGGVRRA